MCRVEISKRSCDASISEKRWKFSERWMSYNQKGKSLKELEAMCLSDKKARYNVK